MSVKVSTTLIEFTSIRPSSSLKFCDASVGVIMYIVLSSNNRSKSNATMIFEVVVSVANMYFGSNEGLSTGIGNKKSPTFEPTRFPFTSTMKTPKSTHLLFCIFPRSVGEESSDHNSPAKLLFPCLMKTILPEFASSKVVSAFASSTFSNAGSGNHLFDASSSFTRSFQFGTTANKSIEFNVPSFAFKGTRINFEVTD